MDITLENISGPLPAFVAGLITSLHCLGMCGPLACSICPKNSCDNNSESRIKPLLDLGIYHLGRLFSYSLLGAIAGLFGHALTGFFSASFVHYLPFAFVVWFAAIALGWERFLKIPALPLGWLGRWTSGFRQQGAGWFAASLGLATPLLPCGPLYLMIGVSALSGHPWSGALMMASFALGTIPLLFAAQFQFLKIKSRFTPQTLRWGQASLALVSAFLICWRVSFGEPPSLEEKPKCPMCISDKKIS